MIASHHYKLAVLKHKKSEAEGDWKKERYTKDFLELEEKESGILREIQAETADAGSGAWLIGMAKWAGISLTMFGFVALAAIGSSYEKTGALIGLGFIVAQFF